MTESEHSDITVREADDAVVAVQPFHLVFSGVRRDHCHMSEKEDQENKKTRSFDGKARLYLTFILLALLCWCLWETFKRVDVVPTVENGAVKLDPFKNAQTILMVVLPLATTALGYWFGAEGKEKAEKSAARANDEVTKLQESLSALIFDKPSNSTVDGPPHTPTEENQIGASLGETGERHPA